MICPVCQGRATEQAVIVTKGSGKTFECGTCGFYFLANGGQLIRPLNRTGHRYLCPHCKAETPTEVTIPVLPPRLGLECGTCEKQICIWPGKDDAAPVATEGCFNPGDHLPEYQFYGDPVRAAIQQGLMETQFDSLAVPLDTSVELLVGRLEQSGMLLKKKRRDKEQERVAEIKKLTAAKTKREKKLQKEKAARDAAAQEADLNLEANIAAEASAGFGGFALANVSGQPSPPPAPAPVPESKPKKKKKKKRRPKKKKKTDDA